MKPTRITLALSACPLLIPALLLAAQVVPRSAGTAPVANSNASAPDAQTETRKVVADAIEALKRSDKSPLDTSVLVSIARTQAKLGDREGALQTLREASKVAAETKQFVKRTEKGIVSTGVAAAYELWRAGRVQAEMGDKTGALDTLRLAIQIPDEEELDFQRLSTLVLIAQELSALGATEELKQVVKRADWFYDKLDKPPQDEMHVPPLAAVHLVAGEVDQAFAILDRSVKKQFYNFTEESVTGRTLGKMAEFLPTTDRDAARKTLDRIIQKLQEVKLADNRYYTLAEVAPTLARLGEYDLAMQFARQIGEGEIGFDPNIKDRKSGAMSNIARIRLKAGDRLGAIRTLEEARQLARPIDESQGKSSQLNQIASVMILADDLEGALRCVEDIAVGQRHDLLKEVALGQKSKGEEVKARMTFTRALDDAAYLRENPSKLRVARTNGALLEDRAHTVETAYATMYIARIQAAMGDITTARKTADTITIPTTRIWALVDIARIQAASGDAKGALAWVRELKDLTPVIPTPLQALIEGAAEAKQVAPK